MLSGADFGFGQNISDKKSKPKKDSFSAFAQSNFSFGAPVNMQQEWNLFPEAKKKQLRKKHKDTDKDGVPDLWDCQPRNPFMQDSVYVTTYTDKKERVPTVQEYEAAKHISKSLKQGDEAKLIDAYEPIFNKMGFSVKKGNVDVYIMPDEWWEEQEDDREGYAVPAMKGGRSEIVLRESTSPEYNPGTFPHEVGHVFGKGGSSGNIKPYTIREKITYPFRRTKAEMVAEATARKAQKQFEKTYNVESSHPNHAKDILDILKEAKQVAGIKEAAKMVVSEVIHSPEYTVGFPLSQVYNPKHKATINEIPYTEEELEIMYQKRYGDDE